MGDAKRPDAAIFEAQFPLSGRHLAEHRSQEQAMRLIRPGAIGLWREIDATIPRQHQYSHIAPRDKGDIIGRHPALAKGQGEFLPWPKHARAQSKGVLGIERPPKPDGQVPRKRQIYLIRRKGPGGQIHGIAIFLAVRILVGILTGPVKSSV